MVKTYLPSSELKKELASLPNNPGVYIFKDINGEIIYIGKAASLKARVRSYWNTLSWKDRPKLAVMVPKIITLETILTNSEKEALLLEANLVKKHMPRYNVSLKDGKRYPWLAITYDESFPRLIMIRNPADFKKDYPKSKVFGPYVEAGAMWETVHMLRRVFPMRQRKTPLFSNRPCMNYDIGLCLAPCMNRIPGENNKYVKVDEDLYNQMVRQVELFLAGHQNEVVKELKRDMARFSQNMEFEEALKVRNKLAALSKIIEKQQVYFANQSINYDVLAEAHTDRLICVCLQKIREGKLISSDTFNFPLVEKTSAQEAFQTFVDQYYASIDVVNVPFEVLLQLPIEDTQALSELLSSKLNKLVHIKVPSTGRKLALIQLASKNAKQSLDKQTEDDLKVDQHVLSLLTTLQNELGLNKLPKRIECFDISNTQGKDNVASMVVFENAQPKKTDYRLFKIKSVEGQANDFASMEEVISRRFRRVVEDGKAMPDLIIIDGGKGQLGSALKALTALGVKGIDIFGLAKKQEEIYKPNKKAILLSRRSEALHLLQRVRDEAHRFAITYHRKLRAKRVISSEFDTLPNVGVARRKVLLDHFGTIDKLKQASLEEISTLPKVSASCAQSIYNFLHGDNQK